MEIKEIITQKILSPTAITLADYAINPYRGCAFKCSYCYAGGANCKCIGVKTNAVEQLKKELCYLRPKKVVMGSSTECFQPCEEKYRLSRDIMEVLAQENIPYVILTKSPVVAEYADIIARNKENKVYFTLNFDTDEKIRVFEESSPLFSRRLDALGRIIGKGINARAHIGPFIPYVCDADKILNILPLGITEAGVELYHHSLGNFPGIIRITESLCGGKKAASLREVYARKANYEHFAANLRYELAGIKNKYNFNIFYLAPEFEKYYTRNMDYQSQI